MENSNESNMNRRVIMYDERKKEKEQQIISSLTESCPALLTINEVAEYLNLCRQTVSKLIKSGKLLGIKLDTGAYRIPRQSLEDYFLGCYNVSVAAGKTV